MANTRDWKTKFSIKYYLITFSLNHTLFSAFSARPDRAFPTVFSTQYPRNGNGWAWGRGWLIEVFDKIHNLLDRGKQIDVIYLGMSKAFDKVSYKRLLLRLRRFGFSGNILNWFHSYSQDRSQQTTILGATSSPTAVTSGVPQGSVLVHCYSCYTRTIYLPVLQAPLLRLTTPRYSRK